jgi:hypothetical protein
MVYCGRGRSDKELEGLAVNGRVALPLAGQRCVHRDRTEIIPGGPVVTCADAKIAHDRPMCVRHFDLDLSLSTLSRALIVARWHIVKILTTRADLVSAITIHSAVMPASLDP